MKKNKIKLYCAIFPVTEIEVDTKEKEIYLSCKFFKATKKEAELFATFYMGLFSDSESPARLIAILSGDIFDETDIETIVEKADISLIQSLGNNLSLIENKHHRKLISAMRDLNNRYPKNAVLDDIIDWATQLKLIKSKMANAIFNEIEKTRSPVVLSSISDELRIKLIELFLARESNYILFSDAKELLFLSDDSFKELQKNQIIETYCPKNIKNPFFNFKRLLKWSMRNHLPANIESQFPNVKRESILETTYPAPKLWTLSQLRDYLKNYAPDDLDIHYHVTHKNYEAYLNIRDDQRCIFSENNKNALRHRDKTTYQKRYKDLEKIKSPLVDENKILKKLLDGIVVKANEYQRSVALDVTDDEYNSDVERFYLLRTSNPDYHGEIRSDDLRFIVDEVITGLKPCNPTNSSLPKNPSPKTREHLLKTLMIKAYRGEKKKRGREPTATEVWNALKAEPHIDLAWDNTRKNQQALYDTDEIIQEMDDQELFWRNRDGKDKKILFTSFETKLSKIKSEINSSISNIQ